MPRRPARAWGSVDRGTCRPAIEPRKITSGCRRSKEMRKATSGASISRDASGPRAVRDPAHARKQPVRNPGDPLAARCRWSSGPHREVQGHTPMMYGQGKSDGPIVPGKPPNKPACAGAEGGEGRGSAKGNPPERTMRRTQGRASMQQALARVRQAATQDRKMRFTALLHHVYNPDTLREAYYGLKRDAAPGLDGMTWRDYGEHLEENLQDLAGRLKRGAYRAKPTRRAYIDKADGRKRPLGVMVLEDKIAQRATVEVLNAIYEVDFLGFSYGFRPRSEERRVGKEGR